MSYEKYFKDVSGYDVIDVYRTHRIFGLNDEVLCHASKKLLLSGVRTGGKTLEQDVKEARDSLNRWLEMLAEDIGNAHEKDGWTPSAIDTSALIFRKSCDSAEIAWPDDGAVYSEYTLDEVIGDAVLSDWVRWVVVTKCGMVVFASHKPELYIDSDQWNFIGKYGVFNKVVPPLNFKNCIWEVNK